MTEKQDTNMPETIWVEAAEIDVAPDFYGYRGNATWKNTNTTSYTLTSAIKEIERKAYNKAVEDCMAYLCSAWIQVER